MPKCSIEINKLQVYAYHGVLSQENRIGNTFEISVTLHFPFTTAMLNDYLSGTLNYAEVISLIKETMKKPSHLLENAIERIRVELLLHYPLITGGKITIAKLTPPIANTQVDSIAVSYEW